MKNNVYLNEQNYERVNKKIKMVGTMIMLAALGLIILGFVLKVGSMGIDVPAMGSENWFEMETYRSKMSFGGTGLIMFGVWLEFVGCIVRYAVGNRREIMAYNVQTTMPIAQEGIRTMAPTIAEAGVTMMKTMAPAMKDVAVEMAPAYSEVAKGIAQGIKEGLDK